MTTYYKVRDRDTGLYLCTGYRLTWSKKGRVWSNIGFVGSSMKHLVVLPSWEIVEFHMVESRSSFVTDYMKNLAERKKRLNE